MARFMVLPIVTGNEPEEIFLEAVNVDNISTIGSGRWTKHPTIHFVSKDYRIVNMDFESLVNKLNGA